MNNLKGLLLVTLFGVVTFFLGYQRPDAPGTRRVYTTVGEVQAVHATVLLGGSPVRGVRRFGAGDRLETREDGRGRARLDDGTSLVLDRATLLSVSPSGVALEKGRVFVQGAAGARTEVSAAGGSALVGASTVAVESTGSEASFYCASGEAMVRTGGKETRVRSGETARIKGSDVVVAPEKAFNDWTSGMAHPWSAWGRPRASIGELWGRRPSEPDSVGSPLAVRSHEVAARIAGEVATTETRTTYFNAGSSPVVGDFRMALPPGAVVSGFGLIGNDEMASTGDVRIASDTEGDEHAAKLEWAGEGWLRGTTGVIAPGETSTVVVSYVEWLSPSEGRLTYRYPMLAEGPVPIIGEFHASIDVSALNPDAIGMGAGASVSGPTVEVRRADFRPTSDLVVDLELRPGSVEPARAYLAHGLADDPAGDYVLVRSEISAGEGPRGVTLALVLDTSRSIDPTLLEAERALCEAVLLGLGKDDRVVVFASDDTVRPVGPATLGPVDDARRKEIGLALGALRPGGATDLGAALERAADALPFDEPSATVIYVGDGWPTLGDAGADAIRTRLSRRKGGVPRLGAVAVGPAANRFGLAALVRGGGPVFGIDDRADAAEVAVHLLAEALKPSISGVDVDLGPQIERVYPRAQRTLRADATLTTVGRLRGPMPESIAVVYREGHVAKRQVLRLSRQVPVDPADLRRRWSQARIEELMLTGAGREAVVDAALRNGLLTPWTGWAVGVGVSLPYRATPLFARVLDPGTDGSLKVFSARFSTPRPLSGALTAPDDEPWPKPGAKGEAFLSQAVEGAARRSLDEAEGAFRQCRDSRAALRPELGGALHIELALGGDGQVLDASAKGDSSDDDAALDRCVERVVRSLSFFASGLSRLTISYEFHLPPVRDGMARTCSPTSRLPSAMRRGVWFERLHRAESAQNPLGAYGERAYVAAKAQCELPAWADRRTFLELLVDRAGSGSSRVELGHLLELGGDSDAAALVRREAVRRAETPDELLQIRSALRANEPSVLVPFVNDYTKAATDPARLLVVQRYLRLSPHDAHLRRRELALLEALGNKDELLSASLEVRQDPFLNASLLADDASALRRIGREDEARRTFGELVERAPNIPFARAFLGDRLLDEGLYDEATTAYEALLRLVPEDAAASFRLALAHAGGGRLDIASRMLAHVAQTGGRSSDPDIGELASLTAAVLFAEARAKHPAPADEERLARRALETPLPDVSALLLVRSPTWVPGLRAELVRADGAGEQGSPLRIPSLGIAGLRVERGTGPFRLKVGRQADLEPSRAATAKVEMLVLEGARDNPRLVAKDILLPSDGRDVEVAWDGKTWL